MIQVHLDTDLGGDIDDLCALALLLRMPGVELTGVTTVAEQNGRRAGYVRYVLGLEGRADIPVAAGADISGGFYRPKPSFPPEDRYWPEPITPSPNPTQQAIDLLKKGIDRGARIVAIGPYTNLYLLEMQHPGILMRAKIFLMGGYIFPPRPGFPGLGNEADYNIQVDVKSARHVIENSRPALVPLPVTIETSLRRAYLGTLKKSGRLGQLIAGQAEAFALQEKYETRYGETCPGLPNDTINFQHDPLTCAIALRWDQGVQTEEVPLVLEEVDGTLTERIDYNGKPVRVVTRVDGARFNQFWIDRITNSPHYFIGSWEARAEDPRTGQRHTLSYRVEPVLGGAWLAGLGRSIEKGIEMRDFWGYDPLTGEIVRLIIDNRGTYATVRSEGWQGNKLVLEGKSRGAKGEILVRETITRLSSSEFKAVWEADLEQGWTVYSVERISRQL